MPGLGKTTLATKIYNHYSIVHRFSVCACCTTSQVVDKKKVLRDLLNQTDSDNKCSEVSETDLEVKLWRSLKGRRYLIFLDDIWDAKAWDSLEKSFPDDNVGSRVLLTSRCHDMVDPEPYHLSPLSKEETLKLLKVKLFPGDNCWPPELSDLAKKISAFCKGLPLKVIIVAGLLATRKTQDWKEMLDALSSSAVLSNLHIGLPNYLNKPKSVLHMSNWVVHPYVSTRSGPLTVRVQSDQPR
ncbi:OLC1v1004257C1 [Oldenlandia corymbosa var. corymbosa]|uniref:OLC1v1004257C1 n=1 Tax=Oldenlandia corymbosa var. corymbosa TaxID=529605 RepID=A0AAV1DDS0_OLDCO|nr:OLC1v1004257C1 [Oldenlandia corymbosa var. corymbosa]